MEEQENSIVQESKGLSIASMVLGIVSLVFFCIIYLSIPCAILALIFGFVGNKKGGKGMAITGIILGIIALGLDVLAIAGIATLISTVTTSVL